ncbi:MAG TPA: GAF domain-containing protein [Methylomirabilota bacterium]|jgi:maleate isomerase|nr:GAF domain-containing protein [Methylomirabilota bacterium]
MGRREDAIDRFQGLLRDLLEETRASRTTIRVDVPALGFHVNAPAAEARAPGVRSILTETSLDQRRAVAVKWLEKNRRVFVENDCLHAAPEVAPEREVTDVYGIRSEMVAPLVRGDVLQGWVSVHDTRGPRQWMDREVRALEETCRKLLAVLEGLD